MLAHAWHNNSHRTEAARICIHRNQRERKERPRQELPRHFLGRSETATRKKRSRLRQRKTTQRILLCDGQQSDTHRGCLHLRRMGVCTVSTPGHALPGMRRLRLRGRHRGTEGLPAMQDQGIRKVNTILTAVFSLSQGKTAVYFSINLPKDDNVREKSVTLHIKR